ncbi:beta-1,3-galactosyltransferase brn-like [Argopecten irradians]|uniref:beta-1,3-galactosyltransferase brn-like n=1 Tax=Argopecten irradians TaxID=31199 RepID=UPI0037145201
MRSFFVVKRFLRVFFILTIVLMIIFFIFINKEDASVSFAKFSYPIHMDLIKGYKDFKKNGRKLHMNPINPHPFQYIHFQSHCDFISNESPFLLILVKSAANNFHLRIAIRETWGSTHAPNVKIVFLLAYKAELQADVDAEVAIHGDIVQESFQDAYRNNTYKTIMGFNWAVQYCDRATHIAFVDDDHYLNVKNTLDYIESLDQSNDNDLMIGHMLPRSSPMRSKFSKWQVTFKEYPFDRWPPYLAGAVYLVSKQVADKLVFAFPYVKYLGIDDSYLGIVAHKIGVTVKHDDRFVPPPYVLYTNPGQIVYGEFKTKTDFQTVQHILSYSMAVKMCAFSWKCQFTFLI